MKEHGILFSGPLVRAILADLKTQTRRPVKPQPEVELFPFLDRGRKPTGEYAFVDHKRVISKHIRCPFGVPGDRLYVRETWAPGDKWVKGGYECDPPEYVWYRATDELRGPNHRYPEGDAPLTRPERWRPAIHMPRALSRITLEVTDVRVERVQSITEEDAMAEGIEPITCQDDTMAQRFRQSWQRTYPGSWERNDWVWCVSFRRLA